MVKNLNEEVSKIKKMMKLNELGDREIDIIKGNPNTKYDRAAKQFQKDFKKDFLDPTKEYPNPWEKDQPRPSGDALPDDYSLRSVRTKPDVVEPNVEPNKEEPVKVDELEGEYNLQKYIMSQLRNLKYAVKSDQEGIINNLRYLISISIPDDVLIPKNHPSVSAIRAILDQYRDHFGSNFSNKIRMTK